MDGQKKEETGEVMKEDRGQTAMRSNFGYILVGPSKTSSFVANQPLVSMMPRSLLAENHENDIMENLKRFWDFESIGKRVDCIS